ncbi:hypothetical protein B0A55_05394, partial [Friedmanniomyces simplex]
METMTGNDEDNGLEEVEEYLQICMPFSSPGVTTFAYQQALQNRIPDGKLRVNGEYDARWYKPTFIHDCLMLPGSLANLLGKIDIVELTHRMTPALLPGFHAHVHADTLQPCILQSTNTRDYVQGMVVFGLGAQSRELIYNHYQANGTVVEANTPDVAHDNDGNSDRVLEDQASRIQVEPETDKWGFPPPSSHLFAGNDGRASLKQSRPLPAAFGGPSNMERMSKTLTPRKGRRSSFIQQVRTPVKTAFLQPRPIIRPRITSENDHEEFESWAKVTAERIARAELHKRDANMSASTSVAGDESEPARKRRRIEHDEDDAWDHRIADIEADILSRDRPGVYLNPPGAKDIKAQYFRQKGRPRNAQIVVVKGAWLKDLQWFKEDTVRMAPLATRRRTSLLFVRNPRSVAERKLEEKSDHNTPAATDVEIGTQSDAASPVDDEVASNERRSPNAAGRVEHMAVDAEPTTPGKEPALLESDGVPAVHAVAPQQESVPTSTPQHYPRLPPERERAPLATPQASSTPMPDAQATPVADSATYDKAHVLAHLDEEFHHVGNGFWKRGPRTNKKRRRATEPVIEPTAVVAQTVSDSPEPAAKRLRSALQSGGGQTVGSAPGPRAAGTSGVEGDTGGNQETTRRENSRSAQVQVTNGIHHMIDTGGQGSAMDASPAADPDITRRLSNTPAIVPTNTEPTPKFFDRQYVLAHADEEFHHVGKGRWRRGPKASKSKSEVTVMPSLGEPSVTSTNTEPPSILFDKGYVLAHAEEEFYHVGNGRWRRGPSKSRSEVTGTPSSGEPYVASTNAEPPPILFDKEYVLAHTEEEFHHLGNGRWRRGPRPSKSRSEVTVAPSPGLSGTAGATLTTGDASARSPETQPHEGQIAIAPDAATDTVQLVHNLEDVAPKIDGSMVVEAAATPITGSDAQILPIVSPPQIPQTRPVEPVVGDLFPELADGTKEVTVSPSHSHTGIASPAVEAIQPQPAPGDNTGQEPVADGPRQRTRLVLDIIQQCGGAFPGNREIWYPYATSWRKDHDRLPQRLTLDRVVKGLIDSHKLKKITFSFQSRLGLNETRSILALPEIEPTADRISTLKTAIINSFPAPYVPPEAAVSEALRSEIS